MLNRKIIKQEISVVGDVGTHFLATDDLTGIIHSVSDISGIPIFKIEDTGDSTFTGPTTGITPTTDFHFATKKYVDDNSGGLTDAPSDGSTYGRNNGTWAIVAGGGGGDVFLANTQTFTGVNTFSAETIISGGNLTMNNNQRVAAANNQNWFEVYNGATGHLTFNAGHTSQTIHVQTGGADRITVTTDQVLIPSGVKLTSNDYYLGSDRLLYTSASNHIFSLRNAANTVTIAGDGTGEGKLTTGQFQSSIATGTAPLIIASTTVVDNLNADTVDGIEASQFIRNDASGSASGIYTFTNATASTGLGTGALRISGGIDVALNSYFGSQIYLANGKYIYIKDSVGNDTRLIGMATNNNIYMGHVDNVAAGSVIIRTEGSDRMTINSAGSTTFTGNVNAVGFYETSDARLKENIVSLDNVFKTFNFKHSDKKRYGVIAQEIEKENPDMVETNEEGLKSVNYTEVLIKELVELKARVKQLENGKR